MATSEAKWTPEQLSAINEKGKNLLVAAAAGAGKTAVLVERIIKKITSPEDNLQAGREDNSKGFQKDNPEGFQKDNPEGFLLDALHPLDIDKLLVVTFTNAAAAEMRERIGEAISKELDKHPDNTRLQRQMTLLGKASITTIHSFCLDVIRNNFHCIDIDPDFRIGDETECSLLKQEVIEELFEELYDENNITQGFVRLVEAFGSNKDDSAIISLILRLYSFTQSCPEPEKWLDEMLDLCKDLDKAAWMESLIGMSKIELTGILDMVIEAKGIACSHEGLEKYAETIELDLYEVEKLIRVVDKALESKPTDMWDDIVLALTSCNFDRLGRCGKDVDEAAKERVKELRESYKIAVKSLKEEYFFLPLSEIAKDTEYIYPALEALCNITKEFLARYSAKKKRKSMVDFNDLEHLCLKILLERDCNGEGELKPTKIAMLLKEKYEEILVDEYQDSNEVQEYMLKAISRVDLGRPNIFMVGDVKQSIYRFRQARPDLFMAKYRSYPPTSGYDSMKIQLYKNFRSRKNVVDSVNFIFKQIMSNVVGELDYNDNEALNPGAVFPSLIDEKIIIGGDTELHIIDLKKNDGEDAEGNEGLDSEGDLSLESSQSEADELEELDNIQTEALLVAKRIKELMSKTADGKEYRIFDKGLGDYRAVDFKDIVILLRTTKNWAETFVDILSLQGIPAFADTGTGYFKTVEIQIIISLLEVIDNPLQDIPLLSVLRSPIGGFDVEELAQIRLNKVDGPIYYSLSIASEGNESYSQKAQSFIEKLNEWKKQSLYMPVDELIWKLLTETSYYSFVGAMPGGEQRQANLRLLFERARQYEKSSYKGLFNFINFINRLKESSGDLGSAKTLSENVVRIMSIHKSKGLEFPVVFVSGCGKKFNMMDLNDKVLLHQDLGFGPDFVDVERRIAYPTVQKQALKVKIKLETISEEMRILYVAFTRAKEKLIITGTTKDFGRSVQKWGTSSKSKGDKLKEYAMLKSTSYLDWVCPAVLRHKNSGDFREYFEEMRTNSSNAYSTCNLVDDTSSWSFKRWLKGEFKLAEVNGYENKGILLEDLISNAVESEFKDEIVRRLEFCYDYKNVEKIEAKITVTELKRRFLEQEGKNILEQNKSQLIKRPAFLEERVGLTAAQKGTIQHFVMQHVDIYKPATAESILGQIDEMVNRVLITKEQAQTVNVKGIVNFLKTDICSRMRKSTNIYREIPFNLKLNPADLGYSGVDDEMILLQGIIDCYFVEEDGKAVLIDYKTDKIFGDPKNLAEKRYSTQLEYYKKAIETIEGIEVKESYIYFFDIEELIKI